MEVMLDRRGGIGYERLVDDLERAERCCSSWRAAYAPVGYCHTRDEVLLRRRRHVNRYPIVLIGFL